MDTPKKTYRKTDPDNPARKHFAQLYATGDPDKGLKPNNATQSYKAAFPGTPDRSARQLGYELLTNLDVQADIDQQRQMIEALGGKAIRKIDSLMDTDDENIAGVNDRYVSDQNLGKATQKVITAGVYVYVEMPLTPGSKPPQEVIDALKDD